MSNIFEVIDSRAKEVKLRNKCSFISKIRFLRKRIEKIEKNGLIIQNPCHIFDKFADRTDEIMLNNVNGVKKFLINFEQFSEKSALNYGGIINRLMMKIREKLKNNSEIIACAKENYKLVCIRSMTLNRVRYQRKSVGDN
jgi:hypothetical protein